MACIMMSWIFESYESLDNLHMRMRNCKEMKPGKCVFEKCSNMPKIELSIVNKRNATRKKLL